MTLPDATLYLAPGASRDQSGALSPVLAGDVAIVAGVHGNAWSIVRKASNLLRVNPSAEDGVTGPYAGIAVTDGLTLEHDTTEATHGRASAHVTGTAGSLGKRLVWGSSQLAYITGETAAVVSVDLWGASGDVTLEASGTYVDGTSFTGTRSGYITVPSEPARYVSPVAVLDPNRTVDFVRLSIWLASDTADFHADAAQFEIGTVATPFSVGRRTDQTITVKQVSADLSQNGPVAESDYDPTRTIHFVGDLHVGKTGSAERRAAVELDFATLDGLVSHRVYVGDLVETGTDAGELIDAHVWIEGFTGSTFDVIFGNHDYGGDPDSGITGDTLATEWGYAGRHWTKEYADFVLIGLNSRKHGPLSPAEWVYLYAEDLTYLDDTLTSFAAKDCIIIFHAPLWQTVTYGSFPSTDGRYAATPRTELYAIINDHANARMWVSGHTHTSTEDPDIFVDLDIGARSILCLNCSAIAYVNGGTAGVESLGPLRSPVVTIEPEHVVVRWRDHTATDWAIVGGMTATVLPPYPANGNIAIRYTENATPAVAHLNGPGSFGDSGVLEVDGHTVTLRTTDAIEVESLIAFDGALTDSQKTELEALADWSTLFEPLTDWPTFFASVGLTSARMTKLDNLDAAISTRAAASAWTDARAAKLDLLGTGVVDVRSPISLSGDVEIVVGDSTALAWSSTGWPNLTAKTATFQAYKMITNTAVFASAKTVTISNAGAATQNLSITLAGTDTDDFVQGVLYRYEVNSTAGLLVSGSLAAREG